MLRISITKIAPMMFDQGVNAGATFRPANQCRWRIFPFLSGRLLNIKSSTTGRTSYPPGRIAGNSHTHLCWLATARRLFPPVGIFVCSMLTNTGEIQWLSSQPRNRSRKV